MITINKARIHDIDKINQLQPEGWNDISAGLLFYLHTSNCFLYKATFQQKIVGCGAVILHNNCAWLAHIIVHKNHQRQGIGLHITQFLLEKAQQHTDTALLIATEMGYPVYQKLGFEEQEHYSLYTRTAPHQPREDAHVVAYQPTHENQVLEMDFEISGEQRAHLLLPRLKHALVYEKDGLVTGFCVPSWGEGLTIAQTPEAGTALMHFNLTHKNKIAFPSSNQIAQRYIQKNGFEPFTKIKHIKMIKGKKLQWYPNKIYGRIAGKLG